MPSRNMIIPTLLVTHPRATPMSLSQLAALIQNVHMQLHLNWSSRNYNLLPSALNWPAGYSMTVVYPSQLLTTLSLSQLSTLSPSRGLEPVSP